MGFDDGLDQAQAEAEAALGAALVAAVEASQMRGSSSGGMPMPVSRTLRIASPSSRCVAIVDPPASRRVLHRVVEQVGDHLSHPVAIDVDPELVGRLVFERDAFLLRDVLVQLDGLRDELGEVDGLARSRIVPVSASEMSISVLSIASTRSDSSRQSASASRSAAASPRDWSAVSAMPAQARHRRAQVVRDVVERAAHAGDERLDPSSIALTSEPELVERVPVSPAGTRDCTVPGAHDFADGRR